MPKQSLQHQAIPTILQPECTEGVPDQTKLSTACLSWIPWSVEVDLCGVVAAEGFEPTTKGLRGLVTDRNSTAPIIVLLLSLFAQR